MTEMTDEKEKEKVTNQQKVDKIKKKMKKESRKPEKKIKYEILDSSGDLVLVEQSLDDHDNTIQELKEATIILLEEQEVWEDK